jgi:adenylate kinase
MLGMHGPSFDEGSPARRIGREWRWKIALVGPPGSGKGTQATRLARALGLIVLSTGDLARRAARESTERGRAVNAHMSSGSLVPDALICELLVEAIPEVPIEARGLLFDGFPRTDRQAQELEERILDAPIDVYIELRVDEELLLERLTARDRDDDKDLTVLRRLDEFDWSTRPMIERLRADGRVLTVNGNEPPANVHRDITDALDRYARRLVNRSIDERG